MHSPLLQTSLAGNTGNTSSLSAKLEKSLEDQSHLGGVCFEQRGSEADEKIFSVHNISFLPLLVGTRTGSERGDADVQPTPTFNFLRNH